MTDSDTIVQQPTHGAPAPLKNHTGSFALLWLFVVLIVAAICFGGLFVLQQSKSQQQIIDSLRTQVEQQAQAIETRQQLLEDNLDKEFVEQQASIQTNLNDLAEQVDSNNARLLSLSSVNRDEWKLQEAQYLLRLADQRILLEKDSQNALALALSADDVLRDIDQADLVGVRKLLAEEIAVLKLAGVIDREGIYLRLSALSNQIDAIPFIEPLGVQEEVLEEDVIPADETFKQKLTRNFYALMHKLGSYVRVRDHGKTINAVLPPSEQKYLQQNLRLMLEQAQVALLRNEEGIYQESLVKAQNWINQYYSLNEKAAAVLEELQSLQQEEISPDLSNFSNSSSALADYITKREKMAAARRGVRQ
ncbi:MULTISPECIES: uroporphyrinogen-III C-methyltransferase [Cellvibrio]|uniref:Uroporphyrin-3 C-methyltransferase n=1 Tax=Cellvibrio fibrivorans TaxID=126350 RepID=A0ABU1UTR7_9GAMM|nr:uroporphyrinogen-III C-methyltransferase [Cellvibrio fibrivorans]MDR7088528.1 uroporphyrin-3 C-methyltransferase [Cellvibrio fibrivorans]